MQSAEFSFHQDLNSDGVTGLHTTVIEAQGSNSLVEVANNFFLYPVGGSSGPELSFNGAPFVAGQTGAWTPIAAEKTTSGYEIAWQIPGTENTPSGIPTAAASTSPPPASYLEAARRWDGSFINYETADIRAGSRGVAHSTLRVQALCKFRP